MTRRFEGIIASSGAVSAPAYLRRAPGQVVKRTVRDADKEAERLRAGISRSRTELEAAANALREEGSEAALVFDAHLLMHSDSMLVDAALAMVEGESVCAEWAIHAVVENLKRPLMESASAYLRERATDIEQVGRHIVRELRGERSAPPLSRCVVVAHELSPGFAMELMAGQGGRTVVALVSEEGSASSHTAILAGALGIPAIVGVAGITEAVQDGQHVLVDALSGHVLVGPSAAEEQDALERQRAHEVFQATLTARSGAPVRSVDEVDVAISANIELPEEAASAASYGASGIGLYRTEFLFLARDTVPSEDEQYAAYQAVLEQGPPGRTVFRALDIGGDKLPRTHRIPMGPNPALGLRSLRLLLEQPELLRTQVRALLRAGSGGDAALMFPLVTSVEAFREVKALVNSYREELTAEGVACAALPLGAMVEAPAAALQVRALCAEADFLSVGTNDLVQYTLAADRSEAASAKRATPFHPAVLRLLDIIAREASVPVSVCGEMAADPFAIPLLLGFGFRHLSVPPALAPLAAEVVRRCRVKDLRSLADGCLEEATTAGVRGKVEAALRESLGELWDGARQSEG